MLGRHGRYAAGQPDEGAHLTQADRLDGQVDGPVDVDDRRGDLVGGRRVAAQVALGEPHATDVDRASGLHRVGAPDELRGAATDVDDEIGPLHLRGDEVTGGPEEGQPSLLLAADDLGCDVEVPERCTDPGDELVGVARVAGGGGGDEPDAVDGILTALGRVVAGHRQRARQRFRGEHPRLVDPAAQPDDLHPPHQLKHLPGLRIDVGDKQSQRIGPAVDGPDSDLPGGGSGARRGGGDHAAIIPSLPQHGTPGLRRVTPRRLPRTARRPTRGQATLGPRRRTG
ncbi:MAG: hypothetical protein BWY91_01029 [bacterium ADurb.BinA028]|nr:MAG: hypothetical protein BWY91_01029 [bacterium ADurb.BinA028]